VNTVLTTLKSKQWCQINICNCTFTQR